MTFFSWANAWFRSGQLPHRRGRPRRAPAAPPPPPDPRPTAGGHCILLLGQRLVQQPGGLGGLQPPRHRRQALGQLLAGIAILLLGQAPGSATGRPRRAPAAPPPPPGPRPTASGHRHPSPGPTPGSATGPLPHSAASAGSSRPATAARPSANCCGHWRSFSWANAWFSNRAASAHRAASAGSSRPATAARPSANCTRALPSFSWANAWFSNRAASANAGGLGGLQPPRHRRQALGQLPAGIVILLLGQRLVQQPGGLGAAPAAPPPPPGPRPTARGHWRPSPGPTPGSATGQLPRNRAASAGSSRPATAARPRPTARGHWHPSPGPTPGSATGPLPHNRAASAGSSRPATAARPSANCARALASFSWANAWFSNRAASARCEFVQPWRAITLARCPEGWDSPRRPIPDG